MHTKDNFEEIINGLDKETLLEYLRTLFSTYPQFTLIYDTNLKKKSLQELRETALSMGQKARRLKNSNLH